MDDGGLYFRKDGNLPGLSTRGEWADSLQELQSRALCAQGLPTEVHPRVGHSSPAQPCTPAALQTLQTKPGEQSLTLLPLPRAHMGQAEGYVELAQHQRLGIQLRAWFQQQQSSETLTSPCHSHAARGRCPGSDEQLDSQQNWLQVSPAITASPEEQRHLHPLLLLGTDGSLSLQSHWRRSSWDQHRRNRPQCLQSPALFLEGKSCSLMERSQSLGHLGQLWGRGWQTGRHSEPGRPSVPSTEISELASGSHCCSSHWQSHITPRGTAR